MVTSDVHILREKDTAGLDVLTHARTAMEQEIDSTYVLVLDNSKQEYLLGMFVSVSTSNRCKLSRMMVYGPLSLSLSEFEIR